MVQVKASYQVRPGHFGKDEGDILSLWCEGFDGLSVNAAKKKLAWTYTDNPSGEGLAFLLSDDNSGEIAGIQCLGFRDWGYSGASYKSGIMADFVVGQKHRSLGPALKLLKGVISEAKSSVDFIYGFPNSKAQPVFKRAGYKELGRIGRYAKVLRSKRVLKDRVPAFLVPLTTLLIDCFIRIHAISYTLLFSTSIKAEWSEGFDERFDQLWDFSRTQCEFISNRSSSVLAWRFEVETGQNDWKIFTIINKERELYGYIVVKIVKNVAIVGDFFVKKSGKNLQRLFLLFSFQALKLGCDSISLEFFGAQRIVSQLNKVGFKLRDDNSIYYLPCNERLALSKEFEWYVTGYDRDT